ncbi:MAG: hypothetical protein ACIALR_14835 [Blastopirellula sp. JB062]
MGNLLKGATAWLSKTIRQAAPTPVRYVRGSTTLEIADAVRGSSDFEAIDGDGYSQNSRSIDWLIDPAQLVIDGVPIKPRKSDKIHELNDAGDVVATYVVAGSPGVPEVEAGGQLADLIRIHTTRIG